MKEVIVKLSGGYAWKFYNLPDKVGGHDLSDEYKNLRQSDYNIGFDKNNRKIFLERLEYLTRKDQNIKLKFPLDELAVDTPYHLDDRKDYIKYPKRK